jgi:sortase A
VARSLLWLERLLLVAGAAMMIWCGVVVADAVLAQWTARVALQTTRAVPPPPFPVALDEEVTDLPSYPVVETGAAIAALSIPRVQLSAAVLEGSDASTLLRGPGHLENTALPGEIGNIVIAGHRDSFFWPLRNIRLDDDIYLDARGEQYHYKVTSVRVVDPRDVSVLEQTEGEVVTLITCYPFWVFGRAPDRFIVRASRVGFSTPAQLETSAPSVSGVWDDEGSIRQVLRRYLLLLPAGQVTVESGERLSASGSSGCQVTVNGDRASAVCESVAAPSVELDVRARTFTLERINGTWAIRSIAVR